MELQDEKAKKILKAIFDSNLEEIRPLLDHEKELGFTYPILQTLGLSDREGLEVFDGLSKEGILGRRLVHNLLACPADGCYTVRACMLCPSCKSEDVAKAILLEHFSCGHIGAEEEFQTPRGYVCPKCSKEIKLIGTDYRKPGDFYKCNVCGDMAFTPLYNLYCIRCSNVFSIDEAKRTPVYAYGIVNRNETFRALKPVHEVAEFLRENGYDVQTHSRIMGRSGVEHDVELYAAKKLGWVEHSILVGLAVASDAVRVSEVIGLHGKGNDIGCQNVFVLAIPKLTEDAKRYASFHDVRYFEAEDLDEGVKRFLSFLSDELLLGPVFPEGTGEAHNS